MSRIRWPTVIAIPVLVLASWFEFWSVWGLLFIYWAVHGIRMGDAFLVESIRRESHPILFWLINVAWTVSGVYYVYYDYQRGWLDLGNW